MLTFLSQSQKREISVKGQKLGDGSFGDVFALKDQNDKETGLVCKRIRLDDKPLRNGATISRRTTLKGAINEAFILDKLGRLEGYKQTPNYVYLIMKRINGVEPGTNDTFRCFQALRKLHRLGIAHIDSQPSNYLVTEKSAEAIDFMESRQATRFTTFLDSNLFHKAYQIPDQLLANQMREMKIYADEQNYFALKELVKFTALAIGFIYNLSASDVSDHLVLNFLAQYTRYEISKEICSIFWPENGGVMANSQMKLQAQATFYLSRIVDLYFNYSSLALYWLKTGIGSLPMFFPLLRVLTTCHELLLELAPEPLLTTATDLYFRYRPSMWTTPEPTPIIQDRENLSATEQGQRLRS